MSLITQAISNAYYTNLAHSAAFSVLSGNASKMSLLQGAGAMDSKALASAEKNLDLQRLKNNLTQEIADVMLENNKKHKLRGFDTFA